MKLYLVLNKGGEGAVFKDKIDASEAISGSFGSRYSTLAEAFHEIYGDDNRLIEIEVADPAATPVVGETK